MIFEEKSMVIISRRKEERMKVEAGKRFIANMKQSSFVVNILADAGVDRPPCFCCLHSVQKTCAHVVGDAKCVDYALYSESTEKVEKKLHSFIEECVTIRSGLQKAA